MDLRDYQTAAQRTLNVDWPERDQIANVALGLAGEAGELVDQIKKTLYHGHPPDRDKIADELGDCLWYIAAIASKYGLKLDLIADLNISKLWARFPNGFTTEDSVARVDVGK